MMEFFIEPLYIGFFVSGLSFLAVVHWYFNGNFNYWKKKGVPYLKPEPFFGNLRDLTLLRTSTAEMFQKLYHEFEGHPFAGLYQSRTPALLLRDPELIKIFLAKDFQHSQHRGFKLDEKRDPLTANIFTLGGPRWRILRTKLTPSFTSVKIKQMFHLMEECSETLQSFLLESAKRGEEVELKEVLAKFSTDIIGTCAFGIQSNSMTDPDSEFRKMGRKMFDPTIASALRKYMQLFLPTLAKILNVSIIGKEVTRFFTSVVKETVEYREKHGVMRNDFLQLLMQLRTQIRSDVAAAGNKNEERFEFTDNLLAAQVFVFFMAGFETTSTTMSFCLHELAVNPDIQRRLQEEIDSTLLEYGGKITYEAIQKMEYLDRVVSETLRKYPPVSILSRKCTLDYTIPGTNVRLDKGTRVIIPVFAIQRDSRYYSEPEQFDPERFTEENKAQRHNCTYLPFGEGPRICIGMRFGLQQTKLGLVTLLSKFQFSACSKTDNPPRLDPKALVTASISGAWLRINLRPPTTSGH